MLQYFSLEWLSSFTLQPVIVLIARLELALLSGNGSSSAGAGSSGGGGASGLAGRVTPQGTLAAGVQSALAGAVEGAVVGRLGTMVQVVGQGALGSSLVITRSGWLAAGPGASVGLRAAAA